MDAQAWAAPPVSLEGQQESLPGQLTSLCKTFNAQLMSKNKKHTNNLLRAAVGKSSGGLLYSSPLACADGLPCRSLCPHCHPCPGDWPCSLMRPPPQPDPMPVGLHAKQQESKS